MNRVIAVFANNGTMATTQTPLWQYDYGQILVIQGLQLPQAYEVHFCNSTDTATITSIGNADGVEIPDQFLRSGERIYAYVYLHTGEDDGETEYKITIPVMDRAEPTDIEPTPAQESTIGQLITALNDAVDAAEEAASKGPIIQDAYWYIWDSTAGEYVNTNVKAEGADGNRVWWTTAAISMIPGSRYVVLLPDLNGPAGASPAVSDLVVGPAPNTSGSATYLYYIFSIDTALQQVILKSIGSIKGAQGDPGDAGVSPSVSVSEITGGHRVTITDEDHPDGQSFDVMDGQGGSGSSDYDDLTNKPQINSVALTGNKSLSDLGIEPEAFVVTITQSGSTYSADKTYSNTAAAISAGKRVVAVLNGYEYQLFNYVPDSYTIVFSANQGTAAKTIAFSLGDAVVIMEDTLGKYSKPSGGIPKTDLASAVQTSLGKADTALQTAPVTSVNGQTGAVSLSIPSTAADVGAAPAVTEVTNTSTGDVTLALDAGKIYHFTGAISSLTLTLTAAASGQIAQYHFDFDSGSTAATINLTGVNWQGGSFAPAASKHYEVDILNGYGVVCEW